MDRPCTHFFLLASSALSVSLHFARGSWGRAAILWLKGLSCTKAEQLLELEEARKALDETRRSLRELRNIGREHIIGLKAIDRLVKTFEQATGVRVITEYGDFLWSLNKETDTERRRR